MSTTRYYFQNFMKINFLDRFSKNNQISNFMKIRPLGAELFMRTERHTDGLIERQT
jgi:hypothetical protein